MKISYNELVARKWKFVSTDKGMEVWRKRNVYILIDKYGRIEVLKVRRRK